ncbi:MAG: hypothetical protein JWL87_323 [Candidatus Adlerbacteria bacterium]|nr:hypothetical protein [Candidatus Adlerbacteria bacterium]
MHAHRLGDTAFIVSDDGAVKRTIVSSVGKEGNIRLLDRAYGQVCTTFVEALAAATAKLKEKERKLQDELGPLQALIARLSSPEYEEEVMGGPLLRTSTASFLADSPEVVELPAPESYMEPGQKVFCAIVPGTHNGMIPHYRPHPYFVLESEIAETILVERGRVAYRIDSHYHPSSGSIFIDPEEAKKKLVSVFETETGGTLPSENVRIVSREQEKQGSKSSFDRVAGQVSGRPANPLLEPLSDST